MQDFLQPADIDTAVIHFLVGVVVVVLRFGIERKISIRKEVVLRKVLIREPDIMTIDVRQYGIFSMYTPSKRGHPGIWLV
jgi:hypothetical protein